MRIQWCGQDIQLSEQDVKLCNQDIKLPEQDVKLSEQDILSCSDNLEKKTSVTYICSDIEI